MTLAAVLIFQIYKYFHVKEFPFVFVIEGFLSKVNVEFHKVLFFLAFVFLFSELIRNRFPNIEPSLYFNGHFSNVVIQLGYVWYFCSNVCK